MDHHTIVTVLAYLCAALITVPLFKFLRLGSILGYLIAGAIIGPQILKIVTEPTHALHIAELGVVMLLFIIGLELNPKKLWDLKLQISVLGGGQLALSAIVIAVFCMVVFGFSISVATLIGLTLGLSSTAFAVQLMDEQGILGAPLGRQGFAILLLQDLAVIPILLLVGFVAPLSLENDHQLPWWLGPIAIVAVLIAGRYIINPVLKIIASSEIRELLTGAALFIVLGTAFLMQSVGLSMGMGAFLAGIVLANSNFRHQLEADIEPFKGLLLGLFFIAVGMTLDLKLLISKPEIIFGLALLLMLAKASIICGLLKLQGISFREGFTLGLMLAQGGEFAFVVMAQMVNLGVSDAGVRDFAVLTVGISMALTAPMVILFKAVFKERKQSSRDFDEIKDENPEVIIAGLGRFGQITARMLTANGLHFTALDKDPSHVDFVKQFGNKIYYGDATRLDLLEAAGLQKAQVFVVAIDNIEQSVQIIELLKEIRPDIKIIARARNRFHAYQLIALKVDFVIRETFESGLLAARKTFEALGFPEGQALSKAEVFRQQDTQLLNRSVEHKDDLDKLHEIADQGRKELEALFNKEN